ncbi:hypothetical protein D9M73_298200 [compost metagenome]
MLLDGAVPGALHQQVWTRTGRQFGEHLRRRAQAGQALADQRLGFVRDDHRIDAEMRITLQQFQHTDADGAATDHGDMQHGEGLRQWPWRSGLRWSADRRRWS